MPSSNRRCIFARRIFSRSLYSMRALSFINLLSCVRAGGLWECYFRTSNFILLMKNPAPIDAGGAGCTAPGSGDLQDLHDKNTPRRIHGDQVFRLTVEQSFAKRAFI